MGGSFVSGTGHTSELLRYLPSTVEIAPRNLSFPGSWPTSGMPQLLPFTPSNMNSHFRPMRAIAPSHLEGGNFCITTHERTSNEPPGTRSQSTSRTQFSLSMAGLASMARNTGCVRCNYARFVPRHQNPTKAGIIVAFIDKCACSEIITVNKSSSTRGFSIGSGVFYSPGQPDHRSECATAGILAQDRPALPGDANKWRTCPLQLC